MVALASFAMTLDAMRSLVYALADEEVNSAVFPTTLVDRLINDGINIVYGHVGLPQTKATATCTTGVTEYPLVDAVLDTDGNARVSRVSLDGTDLAVSTGYSVSENRVVLVSSPTTGNVLAVWYEKEPTPLVSTSDKCGLSFAGAQAACIYAVYLMKLKDDQYDAADRLKIEFDGRLKDIKALPTGVYKAS